MTQYLYPQWLDTAVFYEIYPQSFYDTNGDGIGDLPGIIEKLDYIKELGCNALWINPCFDSPFLDAGYDVRDYYTIAPRYGTNDDMKRLFAEAHARGIRVCLDLVPGHTAIDHPWFIESCKPERNEFSDRFIWSDNAWNRGGKDYYLITGHADRDGSYMPNFFYFQPALNYGFEDIDPKCAWQMPKDHPSAISTREAMKDIMRFWLDMGADGFRVDMAMSLVKHDKKWKGTSALWRDVRTMMDAEYPEAVLISEWSSPSAAIPAGFHVDFFLSFFGKGYAALFRNELSTFDALDRMKKDSFFRKTGKGDITVFLDEFMKEYQTTKGQGFVSLVTGNHDVHRIAYGRDTEDLKVAYAFLLTMPGVPFIYYGDEIGMDYLEGLASKEGGYHRTGSRTPMQWNGKKNAGFSTATAKKLYLPVDARTCAPTVEAQLGKEGSMLEFTRALIALRQAHPGLGNTGEFSPVYAKKQKYPFIYERTLGSERYLVVLNPSDQRRRVTLELDADPAKVQLLMGYGIELRGSARNVQVRCEGVSFGIYQLA